MFDGKRSDENRESQWRLARLGRVRVLTASQVHLFNAEEWKLYQLNIDAEEQARMQETLDKLEQLASLAQLAQLSQLSGPSDLGR